MVCEAYVFLLFPYFRMPKNHQLQKCACLLFRNSQNDFLQTPELLDSVNRRLMPDL